MGHKDIWRHGESKDLCEERNFGVSLREVSEDGTESVHVLGDLSTLRGRETFQACVAEEKMGKRGGKGREGEGRGERGGSGEEESRGRRGARKGR
eukprot:756518-Hanusia_phi.AAC.3